MSEDLKVPVSQTIKYADGSQTTIFYNSLGEKMDESEIPAEIPVEGIAEAPVEAPAESSGEPVAEPSVE
jgi:hypothetical protein